MSNDEHDLPNFDDLGLTEDGLTDLEPLGGIGQPDDDAASPTETAEAALADGAGTAVAEDVELPVEEALRSEPVEEAETPEAEEDAEPREGFFARLQRVNPYPVFLGLALVAMLAMLVFLFLELRAYNYDIKAEEGKRLQSMAPAGYSAPASTTAVA